MEWAGGFVALAMSWGIGANDVANTLGTSVGSGALKLVPAVLLGGLFEFAGAATFGGRVSNSLASIANVEISPTAADADAQYLLFQLMMLCSLAGAFCWVTLATYFKWPVSTTHAIVGSLVGTAMIAYSPSQVKYGKVIASVLSWVTSPLGGALFAFLLYWFIHHFILSHPNPSLRSRLLLPWISGVCFAILALFMMYNGPEFMQVDLSWYYGIAMFGGICCFVALFSAVVQCGLRRDNDVSPALLDEENAIPSSSKLSVHRSAMDADLQHNVNIGIPQQPAPPSNSTYQRERKSSNYSQNLEEGDPEEIEETLPIVQHDSSKRDRRYLVSDSQNLSTADRLPVFDKKTNNLGENVFVTPIAYEIQGENQSHIHNQSQKDSIEKPFRFLMVASALVLSFSHGANDVANAIGPYVAIIKVSSYTSKDLVSVDAPLWICALGGVGIVVGLLTWGYRVIATVGKKIINLTFSLGFSVQFGTALTVLICTSIGIPVSTTHVLIGALVGAALVANRKDINLRTIRSILISWLVTIPASSVVSMVLFLILRSILL